MSKLEGRLKARVARYHRDRSKGAEAIAPRDASIMVAIRYEGDADPIVAMGIHKPSVYPDLIWATVTVEQLERLDALPQVTGVTEQEVADKLIDESVPDAKVPPIWTGPPAMRGAGVAIGIIDTGIDIFHHAFRTSNGRTRIKGLWDHTIDDTPHPTNFNHGKLFTEDDINAALLVDPSDANSDLTDPDNSDFASIDVDGHGTHVAGIAAGDGSQAGGSDKSVDCHGENHFVGVAPEADLYVVKTEFTDQSFVDGVKWVFEAAGTKAAVANLSLGTSAASHDGTGDAEKQIDALLAPKNDGRAVVASAGNEADDGRHAHESLGANGTGSMSLTVLAGDRFYFLASIWYGTASAPGAPPGPDADARIQVVLHDPDGNSITFPDSGNNPSDTDFDGSRIDEPFANGEVDFYGDLDRGRAGRHRVLIRWAPTRNGSLKPGDWRIELKETRGTATEVDCWLTPSSSWRLEDTLAASGTRRLTFNVGMNLRGTDRSEIIYTGAGRLSISLTTPDPDSTATVPAGGGQVTHPAGDDHEVVFNSRVDYPSAGRHEITFVIRAKKTGKSIDKGGWTVTLIETAGTAAPFDARFAEERPWKTVDKAGGGREIIRNAPRFVASDRDQSRTVGSPAAANNVIAVGAYHPGTDDLADFSSRGPTIDGRQKPDLSAPGVGITSARTRVNESCWVSDCCENFYTDLQGTSQAAPHVTGTVALIFQRNKTLDYEETRDTLRNHVTPVAGANLQHWGQGKLNAQAAFNSVAAAGGGGGGGSIRVSDDRESAIPAFARDMAALPADAFADATAAPDARRDHRGADGGGAAQPAFRRGQGNRQPLAQGGGDVAPDGRPRTPEDRARLAGRAAALPARADRRSAAGRRARPSARRAGGFGHRAAPGRYPALPAFPHRASRGAIGRSRRAARSHRWPLRARWSFSGATSRWRWHRSGIG